MPADRPDPDGSFSYPFSFDEESPVPAAQLPAASHGSLFYTGIHDGDASRRRPATETPAELHSRFQKTGSAAYLSGEPLDPEKDPRVIAELTLHTPGDIASQSVIAGWIHGYRSAQLSC